MAHTCPFRVRFALVGIFSVLTLGFVLSPGNAQPGRPGGITGIGGRPPGSITGMPGGISGISGRPPGGITGISGIHGAGISGISGIHGAGISGISGAGISGIGGMPGAGMPGFGRDEWRCSGCNTLVGTGPIRPNVANCPGCRARFNNTTAGALSGMPGAPTFPTPTPPQGLGMPGGTFPPITPAPTATTSAPALPVNPAAGTGVFPSAPGETPPADVPASPPPYTPALPFGSSDSGSSNTDSSSAPSSGRSRTIKIIGIVCGSILLIGALAALGVVVANASSSKPTRRPKRRRVVDDYDD